ncbi:MAG: hypothetical protein ACI845_004389 [Gammaproteobacteria bacterium]|jgi:hypothetical protein
MLKNKMARLIFSSVIAFVGIAGLSTNAIAVSGEEMFTKCGIGAMIFKENGTLAAISNVIWDSGTTAVTSGLAGAGCNGMEMEAEAASMIYQKYAALEEETASGKGQHLAALMDLYQCDSGDRAAVVSGIREDFTSMVSGQQAYNSASQLDKAKSYFDLVSKNMNGNCTFI